MLCTNGKDNDTVCGNTFTKVGPSGRLGRWRKTVVVRRATRYSSASKYDHEDVVAHESKIRTFFSLNV
ncbi:hypothetical protein OIU84_013588 [Salix udensis]|uniref:Uncharacterized protein n=1 Tax=Salix udensis TaxID=889485 RepID=A0AAD6NUQ6_9ROSI|nr:hypothetical protein OIU84_013588 [Salix udensis]